MFEEAKGIYLATRKHNDQIFNHYFMRPIAAVAVALFARTSATPNQITLLSLGVFVMASALLVILVLSAPGGVAGLLKKRKRTAT